MTEVATLVRARAKPTQDRYVRVNAEWPADLPALTAQEAVSAAKRLYRFGIGKAWKGQFKLTSGNRHTWIRWGTKSHEGRIFYVNPDQGWRGLVHDISHLAHRRLHPNLSGHDWRHAHLERSMVAHVVSKGWLDGTLRGKPKPKLLDVRYARVLERITRWESKLRRAENALKKLAKQKVSYEKKLAQGGGL